MRPDSLLRRCAFALAGLLASAGVALAAPSWKDLDSRQQGLIKPALLSQGGDFDKLPAQRREALVKGADRWLSMTPEQRTTATQQFQQWQQMSAAEKIAVLERRERFRKLSPDQRKALLETQRQFLELPLQQQRDLRDEFKELQPHLDGLPTQPFGPPGSPTPGTTPTLGLPSTALPPPGTTGMPLPPLP